MSYLESLNKPQKEAVLHKDGPLCILAGAGAGKTRTLTYRILHLINQGIDPENILAVTFTNKAAKEMNNRVLELLNSEKQNSSTKNPFIKTFHSLGVHILKENHQKINIPRHFTILDKSDSQKIIKDIVISLGLDPKQYEPRKILGVISKAKGKFLSSADFSLQIHNNPTTKIAVTVWQKYEDILKKEKSFDFDDLLFKTADLLKKDKSVLEKYQNQWQYIHIDEYQDTNRVQYKIAQLLSQKNKNICVVGDADQNIYSWRGANIENILNFEKDFPKAKMILLEENYRSTQNILNAANQVIKKNNNRQEKNLFTQNSEGEKIGLYMSYTEKDEANFIAQKSAELLEQGILPKEIAVLYRTNFQSRILEEAFLNNGLPYQVLGTKFFERKEIQDVLAYLKSALNPDNLTSLKRIINEPPRGIGKVTLEKIINGEEEKLSPKIKIKIDEFRKLMTNIGEISKKEKPSEVIKYIISESGLINKYINGTEEDLERLGNMQELVSLALKYDEMIIGEGIEKLIEEASLASDQDEIDEEKGAIKLMTVHAAKGLEFDYVFITGLEEDLFPSRINDGDSNKDKEEERRLFYVALTRARKKIFLSYASTRTIFGARRSNMMSKFIGDISEELLESENIENNFPSYKFGNGEDKIEYLEW
ncbi:MAG: UvrD-helicase domain-containing protein [Patescibacteria group bacterium]